MTFSVKVSTASDINYSGVNFVQYIRRFSYELYLLRSSSLSESPYILKKLDCLITPAEDI